MNTMTATEKANLFLEDAAAKCQAELRGFAREIEASATAEDFRLLGQTIQNGAQKAIIAEAHMMLIARLLKTVEKDGVKAAAKVAANAAAALQDAADHFDPTTQPASVVAGAMEAVQVVANRRAAREARAYARVLEAL